MHGHVEGQVAAHRKAHQADPPGVQAPFAGVLAHQAHRLAAIRRDQWEERLDQRCHFVYVVEVFIHNLRKIAAGLHQTVFEHESGYSVGIQPGRHLGAFVLEGQEVIRPARRHDHGRAVAIGRVGQVGRSDWAGPRCG
jgi:hypothetical protein